MGKLIATNKKAYQNYFLEQFWEAGIELKGHEVKSVRAGLVNFKDSFALVEEKEIFLYNLYIEPYAQASYMNSDPDRERKLLLHSREINKIYSQINERGKNLIPTKIYFNDRGFVKIEIAVGKGKKQYDKREEIKKRDINLALKRTVRGK